MGDEWGIIISNSNNYKYNYQNIEQNIFEGNYRQGWGKTI
jgi:hypothetical protein